MLIERTPLAQLDYGSGGRDGGDVAVLTRDGGDNRDWEWRAFNAEDLIPFPHDWEIERFAWPVDGGKGIVGSLQHPNTYISVQIGIVPENRTAEHDGWQLIQQNPLVRERVGRE